MQVCLRRKHKENWWYDDSGCSKHMTGDRKMFTHFESTDCGNVIFGDNGKKKITGKGTIGMNVRIEDFAYVEGLKFNLLSVRQLCDK